MDSVRHISEEKRRGQFKRTTDSSAALQSRWGNRDTALHLWSSTFATGVLLWKPGPERRRVRFSRANEHGLLLVRNATSAHCVHDSRGVSESLLKPYEGKKVV